MGRTRHLLFMSSRILSPLAIKEFLTLPGVISIPHTLSLPPLALIHLPRSSRARRIIFNTICQNIQRSGIMRLDLRARYTQHRCGSTRRIILFAELASLCLLPWQESQTRAGCERGLHGSCAAFDFDAEI